MQRYFQGVVSVMKEKAETDAKVAKLTDSVGEGNEKLTIEKILEQYKHFSNEYSFPKREKLIRSLVSQQSIKSGKMLTPMEMLLLAEQLFASSQPNSAPSGAPSYLEFKNEYLLDMFHQ
jgi:DNA mismatch repair protein MutL